MHISGGGLITAATDVPGTGFGGGQAPDVHAQRGRVFVCVVYVCFVIANLVYDSWRTSFIQHSSLLQLKVGHFASVQSSVHHVCVMSVAGS